MGSLAGIARRNKKRSPMETLESADITLESGVSSDFRGRPGKRQVTLLAASAWQAVCDELGAEIPWTTRRSNLLIEGIELPQASGSVIIIGEVTLKTTIEVDPCSRMDEQVPGLTKALQTNWRGGVACEVITGGNVKVGDAVSIQE